MGVVIAVPELLAAAGGNNFLWPTISTTVGHLQGRWPVLTLIPVALIVMAGTSVLRIRLGDTALQADQRAIGRSPQGRLIKQEVTFEQLAQGGIPPAPPAPRGVAGASVLRVRYRGRRHRRRRRLPRATAGSSSGTSSTRSSRSSGSSFRTSPRTSSKKDFPFTTLVFTVTALSRRLQFVAAFVAALLVILLLHLAFYPWPTRR